MLRFGTALVAMALGSGAARAAEVTVSPGDDLYALTQSLGAGDVILFEDGVYELDGTLTWSDAIGTADQPVELRAQPGATPILRQSSGGWIAEIRGSQHVIVHGLVFEGATGWETLGFNGLRIDSSSDISVSDAEIRQMQYTALGIAGDCSNLRIEGVQIHHSAEGNGIEVGCWDASCFVQDSHFVGNWIHDLAGEGGDGIRLLNGSQGIEIRDNVIHDVGDDGVILYSTENGAQNSLIGNAIWNTVDEGVYVEGSAIIQNNVIARVGGAGIYTNNGDRDDLDDVVISHNTIADTADYGLYLDDVFFRSGIVIANNVVANPTGYGIRYDSNWAETDVSDNYVRNNVVTGLVEHMPEAMAELGVLPGGGFADFEDIELLDLYPTGGAVVVDIGDASAEAYVPATDFNGVAREGDAPDAGAYEWDGEGNPGSGLQPGFKAQAADRVSGTHDVGGGCCKKSEDQGTQAVLALPLLLLAGVRRRRR